MKKLILFAAVLFAGVSVVKAEKPGNKDLNVNLTVTLNSIQSITIGTGSSNDVKLVYETDDHYKSGVSSLNKDHIEVFSTNKGFKVFAKSEGFSTQGDKTIDTKSITLVSTAGTKAIEGATYTDATGVELTEAAEGVEIFSSIDKQGKHNQISVEYKGLGNYGYLDFLNDNGTPAVYTAEVLYTIIAQ